MKNQTVKKSAVNCLMFLLILSLPVFSARAQSAATKRLDVAVNGFDFNEAAAKDALKAGADINWQNDAMNGETMLIMAIKGYKEAKVIKFLLDNGADAGTKDDSGKTALEWARQYNIGRERNGREILAMLEAATADGGQAKAEIAEKPATETMPAVRPPAKPIPAKPATRGVTGKPSEAEIKTMLEQKFTSIYEDHYCCEKNKVEFDWLAPLQIGGQETRGRIPVSCWGVRVDVKVNFTKQSTGETNSVRRGINGNPVKEGFCVYKDAYDQWTYLTYAP